MSEQRGWEVTKVYTDRASGASESRPGLADLMRDARRGEFDIVLVWRFDRFARSLKQLVNALAEFQTLGIAFVSHQEALDTSTPTGRAMFGIVSSMAELERDLIRERVLAGMEHARRKNKMLGRPTNVFRRDRVRELRAAGCSWSKVAAELGVTVAAVRRAAQRERLAERVAQKGGRS
jgi:DNA invertase Pin-like site-specific DNA recombinase